MALTITDTIIRGDHTPHTATPSGESWSVTWLPGRQLSRSQAITAMILASTIGTNQSSPCPARLSPHINNWVAELGLTTPGARARIRNPEPRAPNS
jgi:hypothetical protein